MKRVLVTGSEGFIGRSLTVKLKELGYKIVKFSKSLGSDVTRYADFSSLPKVEAVVHLAGLTFVPDSWIYPENFFHVNTIGTLNVVKYICKHKNKPKLILASAYIYGNPKSIPIKESQPASVNNPYAASKFFAEEITRVYSQKEGFPAIILRGFNVYGPAQSEKFLIPNIINGIKKGEVSLADPKPKRDLVYLDDVVSAYTAALNYEGPLRIVNIASGRSYRIKEIAEMLINLSGRNSHLKFSDVKRFNEIMDTRADISMAKKILDWEPNFNLKDGLKETLKFYF